MAVRKRSNMIFSQSLLFYLIAFSATVVCFWNLKKFLQEYFEPAYAALVSFAVFAHPLSIEAILAPNPIRGPIAFGLFLHGLSTVKEKKYLGIFFFVIASMCNNLYALFPVYFTIMYRKEMKHYLFPLVLYSVMLGWYFYKHQMNIPHIPTNYTAQLLIDIAVPAFISFFDYSILPFSYINVAICAGFVVLLLFLAKRDKRTIFFLPLLLIPVTSIGFHQWVEPYKFWDEIVLYSSNSMITIFAVLVIAALHVPKKYFSVYVVIIALLSVNWSLQWFPQSKVISESIADLPPEYPQTLNAKRLLAWQLFYEKKIKEGTLLLNALAKEHPGDESIKNDLEVLKQKKF